MQEMQETWVQSLSQEDPPTPVFLPGKLHGQRSLVGCSPWGHKESDMTKHMAGSNLHNSQLDSVPSTVYILNHLVLKQLCREDTITLVLQMRKQRQRGWVMPTVTQHKQQSGFNSQRPGFRVCALCDRAPLPLKVYLNLFNQPWARKIPGPGRSPGEGNGNPLQYSGLENSVDRGAWRATIHGVTKSQTRLCN